jgi:hypothetical protein
MLGSNDKTPLAAIAPGADGNSLGGTKHPAKLRRQHLALPRLIPQQPIVTKALAGNIL